MSLKIYFVDEQDALIKVPMARFERLHKSDPNEKFPEYAGKKIKQIEVVVELENRKPIRIVRALGIYSVFDMTGMLDKKILEDEMRAAMASFSYDNDKFKSDGKLIDASSLFNKKSFQDKYKWEIPNDIMEKVVKDIFYSGKSPKSKAEILKEKPKVPKEVKPLFELEETDNGERIIGFDFNGICEEIGKASLQDYLIGTHKGFRKCISRFKKGANKNRNLSPEQNAAILEHLTLVENEINKLNKILSAITC